MATSLVITSEKCLAVMMYTACINSFQVTLAHRTSLSLLMVFVLGVNQGACITVGNILLFRFECLRAINMNTNVAVFTLFPPVCMVSILLSKDPGHSACPMVFAVGYFFGNLIANLCIAHILRDDCGWYHEVSYQ